jgi:hypothetical protein
MNASSSPNSLMNGATFPIQHDANKGFQRLRCVLPCECPDVWACFVRLTLNPSADFWMPLFETFHLKILIDKYYFCENRYYPLAAIQLIDAASRAPGVGSEKMITP